MMLLDIFIAATEPMIYGHTGWSGTTSGRLQRTGTVLDPAATEIPLSPRNIDLPALRRHDFRRHTIALIVRVAMLVAITELVELVDIAVVSSELDIDLDCAG